MSFEEAYNEYVFYAKNRHKKQGFYTITKNFNLHILPYFKDKKICELNKKDIIDWQTIILSKNFSNNFNRNLYYEFSAFLRYCVNLSYIDTNYVLLVDKFPKKFQKKDDRYYNLFEFLLFYIFLDNYTIKRYFSFMFHYGTRPSETMALRFSDLSFMKIHINHSIQRKGIREIDTPKNQSSVRTLNLNFLTYINILLLKLYYCHKYGSCGDYFIFGGTKPLAPTTIDRYKKNACNKAHIKVITQHQFRHSYATRKIHKGVSIDKVSKSMGHSNVSMTVDVYLHQ